MPKSWQDRGDEFHAMIGNCITEWSHVEEALFNICWRCLECSKARAAIVYYRTPTIDSRMSLADELVKSVLPKRQRKSGGHDDPDVQQWKAIEKDFRDQQFVRSRIAHQPVAWQRRAFRAGDTVGMPLIESWFEIYVSENESLRGRSEDWKPLRIDDLRQHLMNLNRVTGRLRQFLDRVLPKHFAASSPPVPPPIPSPNPKPDTPPKRRRRPRSSRA
jgi:hypothetical protein